VWYVNPGLPDELRPDKCGVIFEAFGSHKVVLAMVDPDRPRAWQDPVPTSMITSLVHGGYAVVITTTGKDRYFVLPSTRTIADVEEEIAEIWKDKMVVKDGST
jgi:hypothetical protein